MSAPSFIAGRLRLGDNGKRCSTSVAIAVTGVALSLAVMILAVMIVMGFKGQIREKVLGIDASITVKPAESYDQFGRFRESYVTKADLEAVRALAGDGTTVAMAMEMSGVLKTADNFRGLSFTGYSPEHDWRFLSAAIVDGKIPQFGSETGKDQLLISVNTADALGLKTGDKVDAYFFTDDNLRARRLEVAGTFNTNFIDHDRNKCFISLATLRRLAGISDNMAGRIEISHVDQAAIPGLTSHIEDGLYDRMITAKAKGDDCGQLSVDNVLHSAAVYFNWLNLLDTNVVVILILMACVAGFTLVSCLFILILERVRMIGALKAMGATGWQITRVFARLGMRIVAWGVIAGDILALGLATAQQRWAIAPLDPDVYYLSSVPVDITWAGIAAVNAGIVILSACIMLIPSRLIAGISPSSTMRYE